jgi:secreted trypsin-like serine protease
LARRVVAAAFLCFLLAGHGDSEAASPAPAATLPSRTAALSSEAFEQQMDALMRSGMGTAAMIERRDVLVSNRIDDLKRLGLLGRVKIVEPTGAALAGQFPWMVDIQVYDRQTRTWLQYCGGTLIAPDIVLSAGHCTQIPKEYLRIIYRTTDLSLVQSSNIARISRIERHEAFARVPVTMTDGMQLEGFVNDFSLYFLQAGVSAPFIRLARDTLKTSSISRTSGRSIGWGVTGGGNSSPRLLYVDLPLVSDAECGSSYSPISPSMLCAGNKDGGGDVCYGDSGGPIVAKEPNGELVQVGVVSFGHGCGLRGYYNVYAWIGSGIGWIEKLTGTLGGVNSR